MEALKHLIQTGRTTRMVEEAKRVAAEGASVMIVMATSNMARWLKSNRLRHENVRVISRDELRRRGGMADMESGIARMEGRSYHVYFDHSTIEYENAEILGELFRWDAKPGEYGYKSDQLADANTHIDTLRQVSADYIVELDALKLQRMQLTKALRKIGDVIDCTSDGNVQDIIKAALAVDEVVS